MSGSRIFIGRLNPSAREKDVERFFKGYGKIRDIDLKRGFGFVVRFAFSGQFNNIVKTYSMHVSALAAMIIIIAYGLRYKAYWAAYINRVAWPGSPTVVDGSPYPYIYIYIYI